MNKAQAGKIGGLVTSAAKARAARRNGKLGAASGVKGGRPRTRPLAQVLLRRRRSDEALKVSYFKLPARVRGKLQRYWGLWDKDWKVNFMMPAQRPATKRTKAVTDGIKELLRLAKS